MRKYEIFSEFLESADDFPNLSDWYPNHKNLMVFGDLDLEPQNICEGYYVRGRHINVDRLYLAQNYFKLSIQIVPENDNFFVFI